MRDVAIRSRERGIGSLSYARNDGGWAWTQGLADVASAHTDSNVCAMA